MTAMPRWTALAALASLPLWPAEARDAAMAKPAAPLSTLAPPDGAAAGETIAVEISLSNGVLWSGRLRMGGGYGSANFSQSVSEYGDMCPSAAGPGTGNRQSSSSLNFSISRPNWQQEPDRFSINLSATRPLPPCEGEGSNMSGFNRNVTLAGGQSVVVTGDGGLSVRLTRARR